MDRKSGGNLGEANQDAPEHGALIDRLHRTAQTRYTQVPAQPYRRPGVFVAALIILGIIVFFAFLGLSQNGLLKGEQNDSLSAAAANQAASVGDQAQENQLDRKNTTDLSVSPNVDNLPVGDAQSLALVEEANPLPAGINVFFPIIRNQARLCPDQESVKIEVISGPSLNPEPGYQYQEGDHAPVVEASWLIKNRSDCSLADWQVWALQDGKSVSPRFRQGEQVFDPFESGIPFVLGPGQQVELLVPFDPENAEGVDSEWVMVTNGMYLFPATHLNLQVDSWVTYVARNPRPERPVTNPVLPVPRPQTGPVVPPNPPATQPPPSSRP